MKYLLVYYTGTYHTRFLSKRIEEQLKKEGDIFDFLEIKENAPVVDVTSYDIIGLGFPIYGFNSPLPFNRYLKKLKFKKGQKFFIYKNSGEALSMNRAAHRIPLKIMKKNKCVLMGEYHFLFPYNIRYPFSENLMLHLFQKDQMLLEVMEHHLKNGIVKKIHSNFALDLGAFVVSLQKSGGKINSYFYRVDAEKCIGCNQCIKNCPEHNIRIKNGKIVFGHHCDMCMRCSFYCPQEAIRIGMLEKWKVHTYVPIEELWREAKERKLPLLEEETPYYKSYLRAFDEIEKEYLLI